MVKYLDINSKSYYIGREEGKWNYIESAENIITINDIRKAIESLKILLDINTTEIEIKIYGSFDKLNNNRNWYRAKLLSDKFILINDKKQRINQVEEIPAVPQYELKATTYYKNMIDRVEILWRS